MSETTLILIRHGKQNYDHLENTTQPLTSEGRLIQTKMSEYLHAHLQAQGRLPTHIFTSPLTRAKETAALLGEAMQLTPEELPALGVDFSKTELLKHIVPGETQIMVGHSPTLRAFADWLCGIPCLPHELERSGAVVLTFKGAVEPGQAIFTGYHSPRGIL